MLPAIAAERSFDWGRTARDYHDSRPDYPDSLTRQLDAMGLLSPNQRVLDIGAGTGNLALRFARTGAEVHALDPAPQMLAIAADSAHELGLHMHLHTGRLRDLFADRSTDRQTSTQRERFDLVTAGQCWWYLDHELLYDLLPRIAPDGQLLICFFNWIPALSPVARMSEDLIEALNPTWSSGGWSGDTPLPPAWPPRARNIALRAFFRFDEDIPFTHDTWRGRIRASRGVGASLDDDELRRFDQRHQQLLTRHFPDDQLQIPHRIFGYLFDVLEP